MVCLISCEINLPKVLDFSVSETSSFSRPAVMVANCISLKPNLFAQVACLVEAVELNYVWIAMKTNSPQKGNNKK